MAEEQTEREVLTLTYMPAATAEAGQWLGALEATRQGLLSTMERIRRAGFGQEFLDWQGNAGDDNSVGTLLNHIAMVELGWNYFDMHEGKRSPEFVALFPDDDRTEDGRLAPFPGRTLDEHLELLAETRRRLIEDVSQMDHGEWERLRYPPGEDYAMTPAWTMLHLLEHEAGHTFEIRRIVRKWLAQLDT